MALKLVHTQLLNLLAAGLGQEDVRSALFDRAVDWEALYGQARRQTVAAVVFDGMLQLPKPMRPPKALLYRWMGDVLQTERVNRQLNEVLVDVVQRYRQGGLEPVLLKGQGLAQYYPNPQHRQPGDIDLYFGPDNARADALARQWGERFKTDPMHHTSYHYRGIEIENHWQHAFFYARRNHRAWHDWLSTRPLTAEADLSGMGAAQVKVLDPTVNAVYVMLHLVHHLLYAGVGLRQLTDWVRLIDACAADIDMKAIRLLLCRLPVARIATALFYVAVHYLGLSADQVWMRVDTPRARCDGERVLCDILATGNFGRDTALGRSMIQARGLYRVHTLSAALARQVALYRFFPSEVRAYPVYWVRTHVLKS